MTRFLLWNVNGKKQNVDALVQGIVRTEKIDVVLLVEHYPTAAKNRSNLAALLLSDNLVNGAYPQGQSPPERLAVFVKSNLALDFIASDAKGRVELWRLTCGGKTGQFALVHGLDRRNNDDGTRRVFLRRVAKLVKKHAQKSSSSIIAGDLNASPFESAVLSVDGLHAMGVRQWNGASTRHVRWSGSHDFFYNPMWRLYGHSELGEAGAATHVWHNGLAAETFWHMVDQVVIEPSVCSYFPESELKVLTKAGAVDLLAPDGSLDQTFGSDHLPVVFRWNIQDMKV